MKMVDFSVVKLIFILFLSLFAIYFSIIYKLL